LLARVGRIMEQLGKLNQFAQLAFHKPTDQD